MDKHTEWEMERDALAAEQARDLEQARCPRVYGAIVAVIGELSKSGIAKDRKNIQQGYPFRGIDDVYGALSPLLAKYKLCMLPRVVERVASERPTQKGTLLFHVALEVEYDIISSEDGSRHTIKVPGEAMDSGDKAGNKAMSAAYKYACIQAFCIPTEGDNDADATTPPEVIDEVDATELVNRSGVPLDRVNAWLKRAFGNGCDVRRLRRAHFTVLSNKLPEFAKAVANEAMREGEAL
jgi:ERF superfamily